MTVDEIQEEELRRTFRQLKQAGLLDQILHVTRQREQEYELTLRALLLESELLEIDNKVRAELFRVQGRAAALAELMTEFKTLARAPTEPE